MNKYLNTHAEQLNNNIMASSQRLSSSFVVTNKSKDFKLDTLLDEANDANCADDYSLRQTSPQKSY